jgi:hypothetical protein
MSDNAPTVPDDGDDMLERTPPVNLTRLDPARDAPRFDATVRAVAVAAVAERRRIAQRVLVLERRVSALTTVAGWVRPAAAAAALVIIAGVATLLFAPTPAIAAPLSMAESAGIPAALVDWSTSARAPSAAALVDLYDPGAAPAAARTAP